MSAKFSSRLVVEEHVRGGKSVPGEWVLHKPLIYDSYRGRILVPAGFITDLASIPKLVRNLLDVNDSHRRAAVVHDFFYVTQTMKREDVDALFLEAMVVLGVPFWKRQAMYLAVRAGGWVYWNNRAKQGPNSGDFVGPEYFTGD